MVESYHISSQCTASDCQNHCMDPVESHKAVWYD
jgi:hypothetical protein